MTLHARKVLGNFGWVALPRYLNRGLGFVTTLVLAKLLTPSDFGLVAIGLMTIEILKLFKDMGLGQALIHRKEEVQEASHTAFFLLLGVNLVLFLVAVAIAPLVADFYHNDAVMPVLIVMSTNLVWFSFRAVPDALIQKTIDFRKLVIPETLPVVIGAAVAIWMAYHGFGVWSIVVKALIVDVLGTALIWRYTHFKPRFAFDARIARELLHYGKFIVGNSVMAVAIYNIDRFYVSRIGGLEALGIYTLAFTIANIPTTELAQIVGRVMFPVFTLLNNDMPRLREAFLSTIRYAALIVVPLCLGLVAYGPLLVDLVYGDKWAGIGLPLQLLSIYALFRSLSGITHELFKAVGKPQLSQRFTGWRLGALAVLGIPAGQWFGIPGIAGLLALTYAVIFVWEARFACSLAGLSMREFVGFVARPLLGAVFLVSAVFVLVTHVPQFSSLLKVMVGGIATALAYPLVVWIIDPAPLRDLRQLVRSR